ncbi:MAG: translocation/assembly module TamB domain-containing protein [Polyangiales bacterium]
MEEGRKRRGSLWRWALGVGLLLALLPLGLAMLARTPYMLEYARQEAERALRSELGLTGVFEDIDVEPRTLTFVARHITLDHPRHGRLVEAEALRIRPSFWALLSGHIDFHNITIQRASVWLKVRGNKLVNGPALPEVETDSSLDLPFNTLRVEHSRLFVDAAEHGTVELSDISLTLDSTRPDILGLNVQAPSGSLRRGADAHVEPIEGLEVRARLTETQLALDVLRLHNPDFAVALRKTTLQLPAAKETWPCPSHGVLRICGLFDGELEASVQLDKLAALSLPVTLPPLTGRVLVKGQVRNTKDGLHADAKVDLANVALDQYGFGETVHVNAKLAHDRVRFDGIAELIHHGGKVELEGALGLGHGLPLDVHMRVLDIEFAKLMDELGVGPNAIVEWTLGGNIELHGTLDPLLLQGPLRMPTRDFHILRDAYYTHPHHHVLAVGAANLSGNVTIKPQGILLSNVDATLRHSKLHVSDVLLGFDNQLRVRAAAEWLDLRDVTPLVDFPIAGRGAFDVHVDGTFDAPQVGGHLRVAEFAFGTFPFGDVESDFVLERNVQAVRFPLMVAKKGASRYSARDFVMDFNDRRLLIETALSLDHFALRDFYHVFHYETDDRYKPFQALVSGGAHVRYTLDFPGDGRNGTMHADADLAIDEADISGFHFSGGQAIGSWHWRDHTQGYRSGQLEIERFSLRKGQGTVNISGAMGYGGKLDMVVVGDRIALRDTEGVGTRLAGLGGTYGVTGTIKGLAALPRFELDVSATGLSYDGELLGDVRSYVRLTDQSDPYIRDALSWPAGHAPSEAVCPHAREGLARGHWPEDPPLSTADGLLPALDAPMAFIVCGGGLGGRIAFDLAFGRTSVYPVRGELRARDLPLAKFLPRRALAATSGSLSGVVHLTDGALFAPETLAGSVYLDKVAVGAAGVVVENEQPIAASFEHGQLAIQQAAFMGPGSEVKIEGGVSLASGLGLNLSGSVDLGILPSFAREVRDVSGSMQLAVKLSGPLDHPAVFGQARVDAANLHLGAAPFPIDSVDGRVTFSAERVLIDRVHARVLSGDVTLQGVAALEGRGLGSFRLEVTADRLSATPREGVEVGFGGRGELSWKQGDRLPKLAGNLRLGRTRYTRPIMAGPILQDLAKSNRADVDTYDPELDHVALDLRVTQSEPTHVENNLIQAEIAIDDGKEPFRLLGTDQRFGVLGAMDIRQGTFRVRDRPFSISDGEITFGNAARIEPRFEMHAETEVRRNVELGQLLWHVGLHASGTPDAFQFELTSDPYLSQDDIALLLAVGMTHVELAQLQTSTLTSTAAFEALAAVTGVEREVQRALPAIDDVHIASSYSPRTQRTEPQLHLGKRIADRVRLNATTALSQSRDFSTGLEYQISNKTSVGAIYNTKTKMSASQLGDVGVDLKWRLEFD